MRMVVLGATGSVGQSAYSVFEQHADRVAVDGLVARQDAERLWEMGVRMGARWIALTDAGAARRLSQKVAGKPGPEILGGWPETLDAVRGADATHVLAAMSGFAGLAPTMAALERGMTVMLANKETLVAAGDLVTRTADRAGAQIIPVDSEHSAIFQCLGSGEPFRRIILTCSGGPFRGRTRNELQHVTVEEALKHPNWSMGPKITIDSATLMNKGLEVIEAHHLFRVSYDVIDVVVHPQSVIHSMVEFVDGATMAQCGFPDMRVPVQVAMSWPERWPLDVPAFLWPGQQLEFAEPDLDTFRLLALARQAGEQGGLYPTVLNAANEVAVQAFLERRISFLDIAQTVEDALADYAGVGTMASLDDVLEADRWGRQRAAARIGTSAKGPK